MTYNQGKAKMYFSINESFGDFGHGNRVASYFDYLSTLHEMVDEKAGNEDISQAEFAMKLIEADWLRNDKIATAPAVEGEALGKKLVEWSKRMLQGKVFATDEYFQKLFRLHSHLSQRFPLNSTVRLLVWQPFAAAVLAEFDKQGRLDTAQERDTLKVIYPKGDRHMTG